MEGNDGRRNYPEGIVRGVWVIRFCIGFSYLFVNGICAGDKAYSDEDNCLSFAVNPQMNESPCILSRIVTFF